MHTRMVDIAAGLIIALSVVAPPARAGPAGPVERRSVRVPGTTVEFEMVRCPGGAVEAEPGQSTTVRDLWVLTTEVTWDLYDVYVYALDKPNEAEDADAVTRPSKPYVPPDRGFGHDGYPAIGMTRHAAEQFCAWLSEATGLEARLPTRAEWIYLAGAGGGSAYAFGDEPGRLDEFAWHAENADRTPHPAGRKQANRWGLHDVHGNVAEWVMSDGPRPIAMGGSYRDDPEQCALRSSQRQRSSWNASDPQIPKSRWWLADCSWVGFRFVVEPRAAAPTE